MPTCADCNGTGQKKARGREVAGEVETGRERGRDGELEERPGRGFRKRNTELEIERDDYGHERTIPLGPLCRPLFSLSSATRLDVSWGGDFLSFPFFSSLVVSEDQGWRSWGSRVAGWLVFLAILFLFFCLVGIVPWTGL